LNRRHFIRSGLFAVLGAGVTHMAGAAGAPTVLVVGDSLSAEYGIARGTGWVALLQKKLAAEKIVAQVVNASVSGDTTAGGRARLPALLKTHQPAVVVIELGSNDALRGLSLDMTEANLIAMTQAAQAAGAKVLLVGMQVPPNYGADYGQRFRALFAQVAKAQRAALVPFLLQGVADRANPVELFQKDRIHPLAEAHPIILGNVWPELQKLLKTK
jgi:acyl-CoA thioesterase-1